MTHTKKTYQPPSIKVHSMEGRGLMQTGSTEQVRKQTTDDSQDDYKELFY